MKITNSIFNQRVGLPLKAKIILSQQKLRQYYDKFLGQVIVLFSGGKDSLVLLDIAREIFPHIKALFVNTGLEYPEIIEFVNTINNVDIIKPKKSFYQIIKEYGYPVVSKTQATTIRKLRTQNLSERYRNKLLYGDERGTAGKLAEKWKFLLKAPFKISEQCCNHIKEYPAKSYLRKNKLHSIIGTMATDSRLRKTVYLNHGCNTLEGNTQSRPLSFWTEKNIWDYIKLKGLKYSKIYDMGYDRTGCMFCMFGLDLEKKNTGKNRFEKMKETHPKLYNYCMDKLSLKSIINYISGK